MGVLTAFLLIPSAEDPKGWGLTSIHTCRSYVHTPRDITRTARLRRRISIRYYK